MFARTATRTLKTLARLLTKGDKSTIDSFRLPSQTLINDWEFRYNFVPKVAEPKTPAITQEAARQDAAKEKAKLIEREMFHKEANALLVLEGLGAKVVLGGEHVPEAPVNDQEVGQTKPIDALRPTEQPFKPANREKYVQSLTNPLLNKPEVLNVGGNDVSHKTQGEHQTRVEDDLDHDNMQNAGQAQNTSLSGSLGITGILAAAGIGGAGYWWWSSQEKK